MSFRFTKMHGLGNDYVYVDLSCERIDDPSAVARAVSNRHTGIGSDGLILIAPPDSAEADVRMIMYNADGSRSQMCGNGVRCVAKYAYDHGLARRTPMRVATDRGVLTLELTRDVADRVQSVRVDMGEPILRASEIPVAATGDRVIDLPVAIHEREFRTTCVSMGNPHAVMYCDDVAAVPLYDWGPQVEHHPLFPQRVNAHWVQVISPTYVRMVTWERGTGPTQACGTGASAVCVAGVLTGRTARAITARLPGGELQLEWCERSNHVFKTGPAVEVFSGEWRD
ncbi:MAG: diaminopimelate epimerase [Phycisphaerales bacterium]|nr:diaminopimelate epimerase [Phycisphaerales bacterium]